MSLLVVLGAAAGAAADDGAQPALYRRDPRQGSRGDGGQRSVLRRMVKTTTRTALPRCAMLKSALDGLAAATEEYHG